MIAIVSPSLCDRLKVLFPESQRKPKMSDTLSVPPAQGARMLQRAGGPIRLSDEYTQQQHQKHPDMLHFHKAIVNGDMHPLVYADWLEEHNMPATAELIRMHHDDTDPHKAVQHPGTTYGSHFLYNFGGYLGPRISLYSTIGRPELGPTSADIALFGPLNDPQFRSARMDDYAKLLKHTTTNWPLVKRLAEEHGLVDSEQGDSRHPRSGIAIINSKAAEMEPSEPHTQLS